MCGFWFESKVREQYEPTPCVEPSTVWSDHVVCALEKFTSKIEHKKVNVRIEVARFLEVFPGAWNCGNILSPSLGLHLAIIEFGKWVI